MSRIDRYILSQLLTLFAFFALVLVIVFWINRAARLFDRLIGDGQTALVFLEFTMLSLPRLMTIVIPIATFAACVYVTNRLNNDSELTVMLSLGSGPWRMARPVFIYGCLAAGFMAIFMHLLVPMALERLGQRELEVSQNLTSQLLSEGAFLNPTDRVTFYTQSIGEDGVLEDVFLSDSRDPSRPVTYTAHKAYLVREGETYTLIMVDGLSQNYNAETKRLSTTTFQDFSFNISSLIARSGNQLISEQYMMTWELWAIWKSPELLPDIAPGKVVEELHARIVRPLFCIAAALVGYATLLIGGFSRFGVWREVVLAFVLLLVLDGMRGALIDTVLKNAAMWPILYTPVVLGVGLGMAMLWWASAPARRRRRPITVEAS